MPDATIFLNVVLTLGTLTSLAVSVLAIVRGGRVQKREVSFGTEHARKEEVKKLAEDLEGLKADILRTREALSHEGRERSTKLYAKIEEVRKEVKDDSVAMHRRIDDMVGDFNDKIQDLPNELIATHKNTGVIQ